MQLQTNSVGMLSLLRGNDMMLLPWFTLHQSFGEAKLRGDPIYGEGVGGGGKGGQGKTPSAQQCHSAKMKKFHFTYFRFD